MPAARAQLIPRRTYRTRVLHLTIGVEDTELVTACGSQNGLACDNRARVTCKHCQRVMASAHGATNEEWRL